VSKKAASLLIVLAAVVGLLVGHQVGRLRAPERSYTAPDQAPLSGVARQVRSALLENDLLVRVQRVSALLQQLGPEQLDDVRAGFASIFMDLGEIDQVLLVEWWARFDPKGALDWAYATWQAQDPAITSTIYRAWARQDPLAALEEAEKVPIDDLQIRYMQASLAGWEESGLPGLLEWVKSRPQGPRRQLAIAVVARRKVLREGPAAAFSWAEGFDDEDEAFKLNVLRQVASSAAEIEPNQAADWVETLLGTKYERGTPQRVGTRWARQDPEAALQWLSTLPPGIARDDAVRETFRRWILRDPDAALAYIENVSWEPWLDPAAHLMSRRLTGENIPAALAWAERIQPGELRWYAIGSVARAWSFRDLEAARAYVERSDLPPMMKRKVFEVPDHMKPGGFARALEEARKAGGRPPEGLPREAPDSGEAGTSEESDENGSETGGAAEAP
jgi:hypothetical protein